MESRTLGRDTAWAMSEENINVILKSVEGRSGVREFFEQLLGSETGESIDVEVGEITEASDDRVLVGMFARARGRGSGVEPELHLWQVFWVAGSLITRRQAFWGRQEALEAAGLSE